jgi:ribokinase
MRVPGSSGVAPIWVEADGTNRIIVVSGANDLVTSEHAAARVREAAHVDVVVGQFEIPQAVTAAAFTAARARGAVTVLNPAPAAPILPELLASTDWLIPNEIEFGILAGSPASDDAFTRFARKTGTRLVVTLGAQGVAIVDAIGSIKRVPAVPVRAVDTTGAGDAFVGAFAAGLALGWPAEEAARLGVACASDSVTRPGTQRSFPDASGSAKILAEVARQSD